MQDKLEFAEEYSKHPYGGEIQYGASLRVASDSFRTELDSRVGILKEEDVDATAASNLGLPPEPIASRFDAVDCGTSAVLTDTSR